jgi:hypothetical protein
VYFINCDYLNLSEVIGLSFEARYDGRTVTTMLKRTAITVIVSPILKFISSGTEVI